jgi:hypothetical protein
MRRLLAFFDPLLGRASLIVEPHYRPIGQAQVGVMMIMLSVPGRMGWTPSQRLSGW